MDSLVRYVDRCDVTVGVVFVEGSRVLLGAVARVGADIVGTIVDLYLGGCRLP